MYIVIFCSLIAVLLTYFEVNGTMRGGMKWGFFFVTFLGAIHYDYGNDYMGYFEMYEYFTRGSLNVKAIFEGGYKEPGWKLLCWLFKPIGGFFTMVAVLNIVQNYIVYNFIKQYVHRPWWPLGIFIYLFSTNLYLLSFSMMRQEFVIIVFLGLWPLIKERKWWFSLIITYLCSFIHTSALMLLPFVFWGFVPQRYKIVGIVYMVIVLLLWLSKDMLFLLVNNVISLNEQANNYILIYKNGDAISKVGIGFAMNMIIFILFVLYMLKEDTRVSVSDKCLVSLAAIYYLIQPLGQFLQLFGRVGMYFSVYNIGAMPLIFGSIKNKEWRIGLLFMYIFMTIYDYLMFFQSEIFVAKYSEFHTIFPYIF